MSDNFIRKLPNATLTAVEPVGVYYPAYTTYERTAVLKPGFPEEWYAGDLTRDFTEANPGWLLTIITRSGGSRTVEHILLADDAVTVSTQAVNYPARYDTIYPPPIITNDDNLGWNSSGISIQGFDGDGYVTFSVSQDSTGVVIGLNDAVGEASSNYIDINHAFIMRSGFYSFMENGVLTYVETAFVTADVFKIERLSGRVFFYVNDVLVKTVDSNSDAIMYLDVSLYSAGDIVYDATLTDSLVESVLAGTQVITATSDMVHSGSYSIDGDTHLPPQVITATSSAEARLTSNTGQQVVTATADLVPVGHTEINGGIGDGDIPAMVSIGSDASYGIGNASIEPLTSVAGDEGGIVINTAIGNSYIPYAFSYATGINGQLNLPSTQEIPPAEGLAADKAYAAGISAMEPASSIGGAYIAVKDGNAVIHSEIGQGCGILLESGRHMLTAAHVVDAVTDYSSFQIIFDTDQSLYIEAPPVVGITIHPQWGGASEILKGYDLAILEFEEEVNLLVRRHEPYSDTDEVGQTFSKRSYSPRVDPETGVVTTAGWDDIQNRYDATTDVLNNIYAGEIPPRNQLLYDFDNGQTVNDALGSLYGLDDLGVINEGFTSSGDYGSASLIEGKVVGITSWHVSLGTPPDYLSGTNATYGEVASETRVSTFADWITAFSSGYTAEAELGGFTTEIESEATSHGFNVAVLGGFSTEVIGYTGAYFSDNSLKFTLTATGTVPVIARAELTGFKTEIESNVLVGQYAVGDLRMSLTKTITAYSGSQATLDGFNTEIVSGTFQGGVMNAVLRFPTATITASVKRENTAQVVIRPPLIDMLWGEAYLTGFKTTINAKSSSECDVL